MIDDEIVELATAHLEMAIYHLESVNHSIFIINSLKQAKDWLDKTQKGEKLGRQNERDETHKIKS
ncbi:MAG: hypothetical protein DRQ88_05965 [Epsilonproteobacteria bacterium]|nr:MAG: hypothetical protein DRQ88_05965 [Campylobacterota bacterium]